MKSTYHHNAKHQSEINQHHLSTELIQYNVGIFYDL